MKPFAQILFSTALLFLISGSRSQAQEEYSTDVANALAAFEQWTLAFQQAEYRRQWRLTDKHIRRWWNRQQFREAMAEAQKRNGDLLSYRIVGAAEATAADLPCTEMGHCFREGLSYVLIVIESEYEIAQPAQPEFVVMAQSEDDWHFGGGTFLNRPMGETSVIMSEEEEQRYQPRWSGSPKTDY